MEQSGYNCVNMFLPTTRQEMNLLGWDELDVVLVTGDSYIDSPYIGSAVIGKVLAQAGYRVGIIAQPEIDSGADICRLGEPVLFWGVTGGSVDSMVANYTALKKKRKSDDYTPGGVNNRRPDRAVIAYSNLIRRFFKHTKPIVLGGIEASLRRIAHYDYWSDRIRGSVLFDAKADYLLYGLAEKSVLEMAVTLGAGALTNENVQNVRGLCYIAKESREGYLDLPAYETVAEDKNAFIDMFHAFYHNNDPITAKGLCQKHRDRYLIQNPPSLYVSQPELDAIYDLRYERLQHPYYEKQGKVTALDTIQFSISTHRGCYGECNFCAIAVHEGRTVRWRSPESVLAEAKEITQHPAFKGYILDAGGPTANMYGFECKKKLERGNCEKKRCTFPEICPLLKIDHQPQVKLLKQLRHIQGIKKVFVASGIRYDLVLADRSSGRDYLCEVLEHHVSGQMKIAPEHTEEGVLHFMGKPGKAALEKFKTQFDQISQQAGKHQFLTYYLIAAHPGCTEQNMVDLKRFTSRKLKINPEQVQVFTPTPSTYSSLMYYTEMDPFTRAPIFVEKDLRQKARQKEIVTDRVSHKSTKNK
jgi:uncharacterized radical SAM protein YgiQ